MNQMIELWIANILQSQQNRLESDFFHPGQALLRAEPEEYKVDMLKIALWSKY